MNVGFSSRIGVFVDSSLRCLPRNREGTSEQSSTVGVNGSLPTFEQEKLMTKIK
jgi:hypothetical protein